MVRHKLITLHETRKNGVPIGSLELKLAVARAEGCKIKMQQTKAIPNRNDYQLWRITNTDLYWCLD